MQLDHRSKRRRLEQPSSLKSRAKIPLLYVGDVIVFYASLTLTLFIRYGEVELSGPVFQAHAEPFTIALFAWLLIFYIGGLYEKQIFNRPVLINRFFPLVGIGGIFLILLFYFIPAFGIAPKVNLFIFTGIFIVAGYAWRLAFITLLRERAGAANNRVMLVGNNLAAKEIHSHISTQPQMGYEPVLWLQEGLRSEQTPEEFANFVITKGINTVVVPTHLEHDPGALRMLYYAFMSGIEVISLADFYERLFDRVSIAELEDSWLIKNLPRVAKKDRVLKYLTEAAFALLLLIILSPIMLATAILVKLTSPGTVFYRQKRVGQNEELFTLLKFRNMYSTKDKNPDADSTVPMWTQTNDSRVTPLGKFLRASHIDEFPQLINVLRGEMSFVGPRPERPEFTQKLEKEIPYYELRYLLKPGITGWAQLCYPYGASVEDAYQKLQFEIYYLKNRSLWLDITIILKTIKRFFVQA
jgi:exopolysaccharide biosynthesis polyprenyl glycosylphosphotransferase